MAVEGTLIIAGAVLYGRSLAAIPGAKKWTVWAAAALMSVLLVMSLVTDALGI
jgi:hypothetical protein